jgi:hypothetical protein
MPAHRIVIKDHLHEEGSQMDSEYEPDQHHKVLHQRMKEAFTPTYQTFLSIIQGVALTDLAAIVATEHQQFTIIHWLLVFITFCMLVVVLYVYMIQSTIWDWIPGLRDATIPFVFGALELFINHTIPISLSLWLLGLAGFSSLGALGTWHMDQRAREETEGIMLLRSLRRHHLLFGLYYVGCSILSLLLALVAQLEGLEASDGVQGVKGILTLSAVLLIGVCLGGSVIVSNVYWHRAIIYARTGQVPDLWRPRSIRTKSQESHETHNEIT